MAVGSIADGMGRKYARFGRYGRGRGMTCGRAEKKSGIRTGAESGWYRTTRFLGWMGSGRGLSGIIGRKIGLE